MRNIEEVLKEKELRLKAVKQEVEALRLVAPLLADGAEQLKKPPQPEQIVWKDAATGLPVKAWP